MRRLVSCCCPHFFPEPISTGKCNTYLAKALVRKGCSVEVVAYQPIHPDWKPKRSAVSLEGVRICREGGFVYPKSVILRRVQLELVFTLQVLWYFFLLRRKSAIVISVFPPSLDTKIIFKTIRSMVKTKGAY